MANAARRSGRRRCGDRVWDTMDNLMIDDLSTPDKPSDAEPNEAAGGATTITVPADVKHFVGALFDPKDNILVRPIETWTDTESGRKRSHVVYSEIRYRTPNQLFLSWPRTLEVSRARRANVFFGVCPRFGCTPKFDLAWQIRTVRVLWADLDHCTPDEALKRCEQAGLPRPSVIVNSGNVVHLYWLLIEPYLIDDVGPPPPVFNEFVHQGKDKKKLVRQYIDDGQGNRIYLRSKNDPQGVVMELSPKAQHVQEIIVG